MGKYAKQASASTATAIVTQAGKQLGTAGEKDLAIGKGLEDGTVTIRAEGTGKIYYFWETEGLTPDGSYSEEDSHLKVRRTFFSRTGKPVTDLKNIRRNELIVVKITLENTARNMIENVVVSDILPACLEIENPRISSIPELAWIKDMSTPDHTDIRDDRIHYYTTADEKPRHFYYLTRAVSTGKFNLGPVSADAMYDGSYHSYHGAGVIVINDE
jgi:hypothetical protein